MKACLDTHAVLWSIAGDSLLGHRAHMLISSALPPDLVFSDMVVFEVSYQSAKGRIEDADSVEVLLSKFARSFQATSISPEIAHLGLSLDLPHGDLFDRVNCEGSWNPAADA